MLVAEPDGYGPGYDPVNDVYIDSQDFPDAWVSKAAAERDSFDSLEEAINQGTIPHHCRARFALGALMAELDGFRDEFNEAAKGYDGLFGYYEDWSGPGNKYFTCTFIKNKACPPPESLWTNKDLNFKVSYNLVDSVGFYKALSNTLGIEKKWISFGEDKSIVYWMPSGHEPYRGPPRNGDSRASNSSSTDLIPTPTPASTSATSASNLSAALLNITTLSNSLLQEYYAADEADVVTAAAMPVLMLQSAVDSMREIKWIAEQEKEEQEKALILLILSLVLMVVPFVGEAIGAADRFQAG
ncbi:Glucan endo-1,3-alpha-glucosidase agn1 [Collariella sp. IMI 366227]|nr:Glucan endo-1,3-alpha-glucosidase agn1 [Collariella sp. IMI 366227]